MDGDGAKAKVEAVDALQDGDNEHAPTDDDITCIATWAGGFDECCVRTGCVDEHGGAEGSVAAVCGAQFEMKERDKLLRDRSIIAGTQGETTL